MRPISKLLLLSSAAAIAAITLAYCTHISYKEKICDEYCNSSNPREEVSIENSGAFILIKTVEIDGVDQDVPMRDIYLKSVDANTGKTKLVRPHHPPNNNFLKPESSIGHDLETFDKSVHLDPTCFSTQKSDPLIPIESIDLTHDNTTVTFLNFDENGRLESLDLPAVNNSGMFYFNELNAVNNILSTGNVPSYGSDYQDLERALSDMTPPDFDSPVSPQPHFPKRDLISKQTPMPKTPFYSNLKTKSNYDSNEGHIYIYVLLDKHMMFTRKYAALVDYAPETENALMKLYSPLKQQPVYPIIFEEDSLDVLTFRFVQNQNAEVDPDKISCSYVYDLHVHSIGQDESGDISSSGKSMLVEHNTPIFIDPEIKTEGVIILQ